MNKIVRDLLHEVWGELWQGAIFGEIICALVSMMIFWDAIKSGWMWASWRPWAAQGFLWIVITLFDLARRYIRRKMLDSRPKVLRAKERR